MSIKRVIFRVVNPLRAINTDVKNEIHFPLIFLLLTQEEAITYNV